MKVVLDTSALIGGFQLDDQSKYIITEDSIKEIRDKNALLKIELKIEEGKLIVARPKENSINFIKKTAQRLGEEESLSDADINALSLAYELKEKGEDVTLATDDYGIQNMAVSLSIPYATIAEKGIKKLLQWHYVCLGCGQRYDKNIVYCEICGNKVKRRVKK